MCLADFVCGLLRCLETSKPAKERRTAVAVQPSISAIPISCEAGVRSRFGESGGS